REVLQVVAAPDGHVELTVGGIGLRGDAHPTSEVLPVGDGEGGDAQGLLRAAVEPDADRLVLPAEECADTGQEEADLPSERLAARVHRAVDLATGAEAGHVHEVPLAGRPVRTGEASSPHVERADCPLQPGAALAQRAIQAEGPPEVAARA